MVGMTKNTNKRILLILALIFTLFFTGCSRISGEKTDKEARKSGIAVDGKLQPIELAEAFIDEIAKFIQLGEEYKKMGMRIQSKVCLWIYCSNYFFHATLCGHAPVHKRRGCNP
jgi:hypothetical protein